MAYITRIIGVPQVDMGNTPPFRPEEIVKDFWQWQGYVYVERPDAGGPVVHPTPKRPDLANMLDESRFGRLWELTFTWRAHHSSIWPRYQRNLNIGRVIGRIREVRIRVLNVWNATLEPDGTRQQFTLAVPLSVRSAHEAVAWTFNRSPSQYSPLVEA